MSTRSDTRRKYVNLLPGDPAPWFFQRSTSHPRYAFDSVGGRYVVMCFIVTAGDPQGRAAIDGVLANGDLFDDRNMCFFGVSLDPRDESEARLRERLPGIRHFWDFDGEASRRYGAIPIDAKPEEGDIPARRFWMVLDPTLRVMAVFPFDGPAHEVFDYLRRLPPPERFVGFELPPPILLLPRVFEPDLCRRLIALYDGNGGEVSGFMREVDGKTVLKHDAGHKVRRDCTIEDQALIAQIQGRIKRRIVPEIQKVHYFTVSRMERYIVCCYAAEEGGHFSTHRDNTTKGTAHRRFAVSINLNEDFDGGEISFPEYSRRSIKIPTGAAVVFSCSLLHSVSTVTRGKRYAFLPFLYDEAAAKLREASNVHLGEGVTPYQGG
jgi:predicted 2-oxoglutarate/Fe(II)-dependent dioxygenase YbiX